MSLSSSSSPPIIILLFFFFFVVFFLIQILLLAGRSLSLGPFAYFEVTGEVVFGEESFVAFLADKVSSALVRVHVLLQVVGLEEMFIALWALYSAFTVVGKGKNRKGEII